MFCLLIQGAGPFCERCQGIGPIRWILQELVIRQQPKHWVPEAWEHQWAQDRGIPWART